jgi:hypothetical protein
MQGYKAKETTMGFNFPLSPLVGALYPDPAIAGAPQYVWDGQVWKTTVSSANPPYIAAPMNALAYNGMQVNGSMDVSQESGTVGVAAHDAFICDSWRLGKVGTMVIGANQANSVGYLGGFPNFISMNVTTAQTTIGAGDLAYIRTRIEGYRVARLAWGSVNASVNVQPITISFWTAHHRVGLYTGSVRNNATDRSYAFSYTHNVADVWQYNTITIPGDTIGTWAVTNLCGLDITFTAASGTTFIAPAVNTWSVGNFVAAPGQVNGVAATSDVFRLTGVVVLPGVLAPTAQQSPLIMRPYDQELLLCQRYWTKSTMHWQGLTGVTNKIANVFHVQMRAQPSIVVAMTNNSITGYSGLAPVEITLDLAVAAFTATPNTSGHFNGTYTADARL